MTTDDGLGCILKTGPMAMYAAQCTEKNRETERQNVTEQYDTIDTSIKLSAISS